MFFALWPDAETRKRLVRATRDVVRKSGGRPTHTDDLHVTVAFLGGITASELELACTVPPITVGEFTLALDTLGYRQRSRLLWITCRHMPPELIELERLLWQGLTRCGFEREPRIYRAHVTLVRRGRAVDEAVTPVEWRVNELAFVESLPVEHGARYTVRERWPL